MTGDIPVYPYFPEAEFNALGCSAADMDPGFMARLVAVRRRLGFPLILRSAYRTPEHNMRVSRTGRAGPHTTGRAVDIWLYDARVFDLMEAARVEGMTGIGLDLSGPVSTRFVHLDDLPAGPDRPRPWIWTY